MKTKAAVIALLLSIAPLPRTAVADMIWHDAYKSPMSDWGAYMYDQNVKRHLREGAAKPKTPQAPAAPKAPTAPLTATDFTRDPKGKDVVAQFISAAKLPEPEGSQLTSQLRSTMATLAAAGRKDNIATAMTLLIGLSYGVINKPGFDPAKADDLVPVVNDALAASPQFTALSAADRQNMYDSMLLSTAVLALVHQSGDKQASQNLARQSLQQMGMPAE